MRPKKIKKNRRPKKIKKKLWPKWIMISFWSHLHWPCLEVDLRPNPVMICVKILLWFVFKSCYDLCFKSCSDLCFKSCYDLCSNPVMICVQILFWFVFKSCSDLCSNPVMICVSYFFPFLICRNASNVNIQSIQKKTGELMQLHWTCQWIPAIQKTRLA